MVLNKEVAQKYSVWRICGPWQHRISLAKKTETGVTVLPKNMEMSAAVRAGTVAGEWGSGDRIKVRSLHFCLAKKRPGGLVKPLVKPSIGEALTLNSTQTHTRTQQVQWQANYS